MGLRVILTGATGMVGEGVLLECLGSPHVDQVLSVVRRPTGRSHPKLKELAVKDFRALDDVAPELTGHDACLYCAGISSAGMSEADYTVVTYDTPLAFCTTLAKLNPQMALCHVSGSHTDGTERGKVMWARVKGKAENALAKLPFTRVINFRPGLMKPTPGQQNVKALFKVAAALSPVFSLVFPNSVCTLREVGQAMIHGARVGAPKPVLEVPDIIALAAEAGR